MFTVGEFSKICQVTIKTLHYYDRIGLLQPSKVDKFTGYRYYNQTQLDKMLLIQRLKRYGFSLVEIAQLMECPDAELLLAKLRRQQHKLKQQMQSTQLIINELDAHLQSIERTGNIMEYQKNYEIKLLETPNRAVLTCRQNMGVGEFGQYYSSIFERIAKKKLTPNIATNATIPPPKLCEVFQIAIFTPRSLSENQCVIILAHGGHPIPCTQPFRSISTNIIVTLLVLGNNKFTMPDKINPIAKKYRAFDLSETFPITNLLTPYESPKADATNPTCVFVNPSTNK